MPLSRGALTALFAALAGSLALLVALVGGSPKAEAQNIPVLASPNVDLLSVIPGTVGISGVFSPTAPYFYVSGVDALSVIDVSDPKAPRRVGRLQSAVFENEAMTLGERRLADGSIQRFVLIGNDLVQGSVDTDGIQTGRLGGGELIIVDVTTPTAPKIVGRTPSTGPGAATTSTHTVACMDAACRTAYSAGDDGKFSIFDLTELDEPAQVGEAPSPAAGPNPVFTSGAGHHWNVDGAGIAFHAGSGGTAAFDISDPRNPKALTATDENGTKTPYNDFIHHNVQRPNARAFAPGREASVVNGNVALITEEDYFNDGDELACDRAGVFETWEIVDLDGERYRAGNPTSEPDKGTMRPLDTIHPVVEGGGGLSAPAGAFCSAHWFDYHQAGIIAQGFYQQGLRLIDVRDAKDLKQFGYFTGGATQVWDAYWAPQRDASGAAIPGRKSNIVYTADAVQGVGVYEVTNMPPDLPVSGDGGTRGPFPAEPATTGAVANGTAPAPAARCASPLSRFARTTKLTRRSVRVRGTARDRGCGITKVDVAIGRKVGKRCRWLKANGRFSAARSCLRVGYVRARGTKSFRYDRRLRLPRGSYLLWSRATDARGNVERKASRRNLARRGVR